VVEVIERMCEMWEPSTRCTLQHWLHRNTPLLMDAHVGSGTEEGDRRARSHNKNVLAAAVAAHRGRFVSLLTWSTAVSTNIVSVHHERNLHRFYNINSINLP